MKPNQYLHQKNVSARTEYITCFIQKFKMELSKHYRKSGIKKQPIDQPHEKDKI